MKVVLITLTVVTAIFLAAVGYYFFWPQASASVALSFDKPNTVLVGQPFRMTAIIDNTSDHPAAGAKLSVFLPPGVVFVGMSNDLRVLEQDIGDVGAGSVHRESIELLALDGAQSLKHIEGKVSYGGGVRNQVQFESKTSIDVAVNRSSVVLNFTTPAKVFSGETFETVVEYQNTSDQDITGLELTLDYPQIFTFAEADPPPSSGSNVWDLGVLARNAKGRIVVKGSVVGPENSYFPVSGTLQSEVSGQRYTVAQQDGSIAISVSPLSLSISVNRQQNYVATEGDALTYTLTYRNNSNVAMENVTVQATLSGEMFDLPTANTNGFFNSLTNTFFWNVANTPVFALVPPGGTGSLSLNVSTKKQYPIKKLGDQDYVLKIAAQIESKTVPEATGATKTVSVAELTTKVGGKVALNTSGYFRDAGSGVVNTGPFPPVVNQPTQYTIHWRLTNYATDVTTVRVSAFLQSNTRFVKVVKSTIGVDPQYNPASGEVSWNIANLAAAKGFIGEPIEAVFQIENTPAVNQVGHPVPLLSATQVDADDAFTGLHLTAKDDAISTALPDDPTVAQGSHDAMPQ